ncbi:MAG: transporter substrate-binding domain-containing protein [Smithellaceae bacterium]|jgi:ABC-type amino acid transport substrate-binding protein|nr:transporter substrate-binding domain-containing protein [Smithellaceae bacterium]
MPATIISCDEQCKKNITGQLLRGLFVLLLILLMGTPFAQADERIVRVGVYENAPKVFTSESGKPSGIFIDIIEYIAKQEDWDLEYVSGTWGEGLDRLARGDIDLMPDVALTAERDKKYSFHKIQVLSSWFQAYAGRNSRIHSILDLNGKRIAIL